jgi:hypothetical protein
MQVEVGVFTAGAVSTQRNEGINKHVKSTLRKNSNVETVIAELRERDTYQHERSEYASTIQGMPYKDNGVAAKKHFCHAYEAVKASCSEYAHGVFCQQAASGVQDYKVAAWLQSTCPDETADVRWVPAGPLDNRSALTTLDKCDAYRCMSVTEYVTSCRITDFVCFAVQVQSSLSVTAAPQFVVLHEKDSSSTCSRYLRFFCTCGYSPRFGIPCRHFLKVYQERSEATFHLGYIHDNWFRKEQPVECRYSLIPSPASPTSCCAAESGPQTLHPWIRPDPITTTIAELEAANLPGNSAQLASLGRKRKFGTLLGLSKDCITAAVEEGTAEDAEKFQRLLLNFLKGMKGKVASERMVTDPAPRGGKTVGGQTAAQLAKPRAAGHGRGRGRGGRGRGRAQTDNIEQSAEPSAPSPAPPPILPLPQQQPLDQQLQQLHQLLLAAMVANSSSASSSQP